MSDWDRKEQTNRFIDISLSADRENLIFDLFINDHEIPFYMTFEEATRVANELKSFVDKYKA